MAAPRPFQARATSLHSATTMRKENRSLRKCLDSAIMRTPTIGGASQDIRVGTMIRPLLVDGDPDTLRAPSVKKSRGGAQRRTACP